MVLRSVPLADFSGSWVNDEASSATELQLGFQTSEYAYVGNLCQYAHGLYLAAGDLVYFSDPVVLEPCAEGPALNVSLSRGGNTAVFRRAGSMLQLVFPNAVNVTLRRKS